MAEGLLSKYLQGINVKSAGIGALVGHPADPKAIKLLEAQDVDISKHTARQINLAMCQNSEIILVMDAEQKKFVENMFPFARGKVFRLAEKLKMDIPDPYRGTEDQFKEVLGLIEYGVNDWVVKINKILNKSVN